MSKRPRWDHSPACKVKVALVAVKDEQTPAALMQQYDVYPNLVTQRRSTYPSREPVQTTGATSIVAGAATCK